MPTSIDSPGLRRLLLVLLAAAIPVFVVALGANSIWDHNEAFYVETPRQMILRGDYITPYFNESTRLNKPVLSYWIVAGLYHLLGISVTTERIGIALGAFAIIAAAFVIGRALRGTTTGLLAALIVATAPRVVMHSRRIFIDVYITAFMSLTLACLVLAERYPQHRRKALLAMYVCMGLGILTKGPIALVLPVAVASLWFTLEGRWADLRRMSLVSGAAIVVAMVAPWYVALYLRHGWEPIAGFFVGENVDRYLNSMAGDDRRPFYFYAQVVLTDLFPWAPLVLFPLASAWRRSSGMGTGDRTGSIRRLLWCWVVVIVGAFSLSATKQDLYIFPVTVAVGVLIADVLAGTALGAERPAVRRMIAAVGLITAMAGGAIGLVFSSGLYSLSSAPIVAGVLVAGGLAVAGTAGTGRARLAVAVLATTFIIFNYLFVLRVLPSFERFKPSPAFAEIIAARGGPDDRVGSYDYMLSSLVYYASRPVSQFGTPPELEDFVDGGHGWVVMRREIFDILKPVQPAMCIAASRPAFNARFGDMLARKPPAEVVLVTENCPEVSR